VIEPRLAWVPPSASSLGQDCIDFWAAAGGRLLDWQQLAVRAILGLDEDGRWTSTNDGLCVARQNGKGVVLQAIEVFVAFELGVRAGYDLIIHTAHEFGTCQDHQRRLDAFIQECPHLHAQVKESGGYKHANGQESINLKDGTCIIFKARTKGGGRGYSADLLVWDEAMVISDEVVAAQRPMLRASTAKHGAKVIYAGSAVDQETHEYGVNFARIRELGIEQAPKTCYLEWSAPFEHPSEMTEELLQDVRLFRPGNPSMDEGLISEDVMVDEVRQMPSRKAATELFDVGDWPRTDGHEEGVFSIEAWDALERPESVLQAPYELSYDVSPERRGAIALSGRNQDDQFHVEIQEDRQGTSWMPERIAEIVETGDVSVVVCDSVGPAASLVLALDELGVKVETVNSQEHGQACGRLVDMVEDGTLAHLGSAELRDAVRGARTRQLGDAWAWSRKHSSVNIAPLVAATLALGATAGVTGGEVAVF
jgi:predicted Fe-Mo cluster-binding NifX family protein